MRLIGPTSLYLKNWTNPLGHQLGEVGGAETPGAAAIRRGRVVRVVHDAHVVHVQTGALNRLIAALHEHYVYVEIPVGMMRGVSDHGRIPPATVVMQSELDSVGLETCTAAVTAQGLLQSPNSRFRPVRSS